jgi:hypothetical protein
MKKQNKFNRSESAVLAIARAIAGTLTLLNEMLPLSKSGLSWPALLHASPYLLVAVGISLIVAEDRAQTVVSSTSVGRQKEGKYGW